MIDEAVIGGKKTMEFQAEIKQLLSIVVNSLYTHKEVFLRELIANASDALDKFRFLSVTDPTVWEDANDLSIFIELDQENRTLTISDNGIGMTYDEVIENIGTIARSGSAKFMEFIKKSQAGDSDVGLIGQFGVGFYSAFMVAEKITLLTRAPKQAMGVKWESTGDNSYIIEEIEKKDRGTRIILKLKEHDPDDLDGDFLNQYTIQKHIKKYCTFITYPIRMNFVTEEAETDEDNKIVEGKKRTVITEKTLNSTQPIWARDPKEIQRGEYLDFYRQQFHDWNEPAEISHTRGEGVVEFTALVFIPSQAPYGLYTGELPKGPQLYSKQVLVMNDCRELLPDYLKFVHAIVESPDLALNISRETLQHDRQLQIIRNHLEKKILESFKNILVNDRAKYEKLWEEFGKAFKGGIFMDHSTTEKLQDLLLFDSSTSEQKTTLAEYVSRMPEGQKEIYYVTGESRAAVERLPQMETVREKGFEVLYFLDKVDEFLTQYLREYEGKALRSVARGVLDLQDNTTPDAETSASENDDYEQLLAHMRETLSSKVKDVRISKRLKSSAVCLVSGDTGYSLNMERLMREANQTMFKATRILELNPGHPLIKTMNRLVKNEAEHGKLKNYYQLAYDQALLIENEKIEDPVNFAAMISQLIVDAHQDAGVEDNSIER
ncbi:MAG TPA: molecular chaperone HtpG [Pyrinomonadaceae bacterium]